MKNTLLLSVIMVLSLFGLQAQNEETANYYNEVQQYSLIYPSFWEVEEDEENETTTLYVPLKKGENIYKQLQISVARWEDGDLYEFLEQTFSESEMTNLYPDITILDLGEDETKENQNHCFEMSYMMGEEKVTVLYYLEKKEDLIYLILASSPQSEYAAYKKQYLRIIDSLRIR
ncbi:MAG: hypothetical protein U0L38_04875 [Bacteroidales bacterium]|nr:hypothetical protein [Bacteroidales bacterium]